MIKVNVASVGTLFFLLSFSVPALAQEREDHGDRGRAQHEQKKYEQQKRKSEHKQAITERQQEKRLSQKQQKRLIKEEQQRMAAYRKRIVEQQRLAELAAERAQSQDRAAEYRLHQEYTARLLEQHQKLLQPYDFDADPYYSTPPSYRYSRNGTSYRTNQYGADLLRQAVNNGYEVGYRSGGADRQDRAGFDYKGAFAYQDANYGYGGRYVSQADYNHYFRQGFQRGYQDGYRNTNQYGEYSDGNYSMLSSILSQVLNLQPLR